MDSLHGIRTYQRERKMAELEHGFAVVTECCSASECDTIIAQLAPITTVGTRCLLDHDWCQALASNLRARVATTIPAIHALVAVQCTYFNKSPERNWLVAYHQDRSIPIASSVAHETLPGWSQKEGMTFVHGADALLAQMIAIRLHLDDCTPDNGPLRVIPDSHRVGTMSPLAIKAALDTSVDQKLLVDKGGIIAMRPLLLHASSKSHTMPQRRVLHFLFGPRALPAGLEWRRAL